MNKSASPASEEKTEAPPAYRKFSRPKPLAGKIGVSVKTLHRWADAGHIHRHKVSEMIVLFDENEVFAFIERSRVAAA